MIRMMIAAAGLSLGLMMMPLTTVPAKAGVNIGINIGGNNRISCGRGRRIVEDYGFRRVEPRNCGGRVYSYFGRRHGDRFIIEVDSRRGRVIRIRRIW